MSNSFESLLTEHEVARLLHVSVATIRKRRLFRQPPPWVKIGASVRYERKALEEFICNGQQPVTTTTARPLSKPGLRTMEEK